MLEWLGKAFCHLEGGKIIFFMGKRWEFRNLPRVVFKDWEGECTYLGELERTVEGRHLEQWFLNPGCKSETPWGRGIKKIHQLLGPNWSKAKLECQSGIQAFAFLFYFIF